MSELTEKEIKNWGMLCHLAAFASYLIPLGNFVGPLLVWQLKKDQHPFIDEHGKEALNFQISLLIYGAIAGILVLVAIGFPLLIALGMAGIVLPIIAGLRASNGESYRYPATIRFIK